MAIDKSKIERQAKELLYKFAQALEKVEKEKGIEEEIHVDREEFERKEGCISSLDKSKENSKNAACADNDFKKRILKNSPNHDDDFIIAEKGAWK